MPKARHPLKFAAKQISFSYDHAALSATATAKRYIVPTGRTFVLERVTYVNVTGLAGDPTNDISAAVINTTGSVVASLVFNTDTNDVPAGVTLAANTFVEGPITAANAVFQGGDIVAVLFTVEGTQTLPAGSFYFEGRLL